LGNLVFLDENFYYFIINSNFSQTIFTEIEKEYGKVLLSDEIYELITEKYANESSASNYYENNWNSKLRLQNLEYQNILNNIYTGWIKDVKEFRGLIKKTLNKFKQGISDTDIDLVVTAYYVGKFSKTIPFIISYDDDLTFNVHLLFSILGLKVVILTIYEVLSNLQIYDTGGICKKHYPSYFQKNSIFFELHELIQLNKDDLIHNLSVMIREGQISCHPRIKSTKNFYDVFPKGKEKTH
jgi:hypothetical protein